jgi:hypothetical protein
MTDNQKKLLQYISGYRLKYGSSPTLREMVSGINVSDNKSILGIIAALTRHGYLRKGAQKTRSILLTDKALDFLGVTSFPMQYRAGSLPPQQLKQPAELMNGVTVSLPTSDNIGYSSGNALKTDGTNIENDLRTVVETAVNLAIGKYFNGTLSSNQTSKHALAKGIGAIVHTVFQDAGVVRNFSWALLLAGLTWVDIAIIGNNLTALVYSVIAVLIINNFLSK